MNGQNDWLQRCYRPRTRRAKRLTRRLQCIASATFPVTTTTTTTTTTTIIIIKLESEHAVINPFCGQLGTRRVGLSCLDLRAGTLCPRPWNHPCNLNSSGDNWRRSVTRSIVRRLICNINVNIINDNSATKRIIKCLSHRASEALITQYNQIATVKRSSQVFTVPPSSCEDIVPRLTDSQQTGQCYDVSTTWRHLVDSDKHENCRFDE